MVLWIISALLIFSYFFLLLFFRKQWCKPSPVQVKPGGPLPFISIVIPARNEEQNIAVCLESCLNQSYPRQLMEIIVADDHSTDHTAQIVTGFCREYSHVKLIKLGDRDVPSGLNSFKKYGIETAISLAKGELIVTTDADCVVPEHWLHSLAACYRMEGATFIAAPVSMATNKAGFLQVFQALDFMTLQGITGAVVKSRFANMCNGANLAYEKAAFGKVGGFRGIDHLASGDDMLLMEKIACVGKVVYLQSQAAIVHTQPAGSVAEFLQQRIRWASKSAAYKSSRLKVVLLLVFLVNVWALLLLLLFFIPYVPIALLLFMLMKISGELIFLYPVARFFQEQRLLKWFIPAQPFHIVYTVSAGILGNFKTYKWKGRTVR